MIQGSVGLHVSDGNDSCESGDLVRDKSLDLRWRQGALHATELGSVLVPRMRPDLDSHLPATPCRCDRDRNRAGVHAARNARAVDETKDRLIGAGSLTQIRAEIQIARRQCSVLPLSS